MSFSSSNQTNSASKRPEPAKVTWAIDNFCKLPTKFVSQNVTLPSIINPTEFTLVCFPQDQHNRVKQNYTTICLFLKSCKKGQITVRHQIALLNTNGDKCFAQERFETFSNSSDYRFGGLYHILYDYVKDPENGLFTNRKVTVYCEIEEIYAKNPKTLQQVQPDPSPLLANYQTLLDSGKFSDVTLIIGEKKLLAHKNILSTQSRVFAAMFENDCEEKRLNRVEITDVPIEVCEQMLRYIYTGKISLDLNEYAVDLFIAADKYQLDHLKSACEQHITANLKPESVATILLLADMHQAEGLKTKCIDYITTDNDNIFTKVMSSDGWEGLPEALRLELANKQQIATQQSKSQSQHSNSNSTSKLHLVDKALFEALPKFLNKFFKNYDKFMRNLLNVQIGFLSDTQLGLLIIDPLCPSFQCVMCSR